ncbi:MAG: IclR family transcriptional regulator [Pararhodobacter sp.]|nr:IclR family transcriptional regulator [Pararhodobacter sp.]
MNESAPMSARSVGAVVHALRILRHLAGLGAPVGVSAIARATGVNTSTCFNILRTLVAEGLVVFDPGDKTYRLGLGVLELAVGLLGANHGDLIRPELERLAADSPALICLWQIVGEDRIVLLDRAWHPGAVRVDLPVGKRMPSFAGAVGRAIAHARGLSDAELHRGFALLRWQQPISFDEYRASLRDIQRHGYGRDAGATYAGIDSVAAVVPDASGEPRYGLGAVTIRGQMSDAGMHRMGCELHAAGRRIGQALFRSPARETGTPD